MYNVDKLQTDPVKGGDDDDHTKNDVDLVRGYFVDRWNLFHKEQLIFLQLS